MKKFLLTLTILLIQSQAISAQIPQNIDEYLNKPYLGMSYIEALRQEQPFLLIFANPDDLTSIAKMTGIGQMVYNEFKGQYNFCVINTKITTNKQLTQAYNVKRLPALYLINTQTKTFIFVDKKYYKKREIKRILNIFKNGTQI